ncbi:hypothetical protein L4C38_14655 [Vibrio kasasachensis]|uniref:hypothetical protein n=1 Tax=Vibrio kasasachensis TaxID=2910248 RepID=UPI003D0E9E17
MANIGTVDFYLGVPILPREEFEIYSTQLFDEWEAYIGEYLQLSDFSLVLEVEEGSIKAKGKIFAAIGVLYIGIGQYGSFVSGLQTIHNQVRAVGEYFGERASSPFDLSLAKPKIRNRGESLARLESLFVKVQRGEMTVEIAMQETEAIFGAEVEEAPEFMSDLKKSLEQVSVIPKQMELHLVDSDGEELTTEDPKPKKPRNPQPKRPAPVTDQFRVEVWRETKKSKRNIKVTSL